MSFTRLDASDFVVSSDSVTLPAWSNNVTTLTSFFTASAATTSSFYIDVYNASPNDATSEIQFSIAYGRKDGSGSARLNSLVPVYSPTRVTFGQYRNLIYGDAESAVNFGAGNSDSPDLIALQVDRNRYKEALFPGTFNLFLSGSDSVIGLTDNSNQVSTITFVDGGRVYDVVSGSNGLATTAPPPNGSSTSGYTASGSYGLFLPDIGLILLNPRALSLPTSSGGINFQASIGNTSADSAANHNNILNSISSGGSFTLNAQETISSDYLFIRIRNSEYNYTTNPSIISGSTGELIYSNFINSPQTFPTTVGLYNDNNELLAVAKLSKPLVKDFTKEALIRVKLDW